MQLAKVYISARNIQKFMKYNAYFTWFHDFKNHRAPVKKYLAKSGNGCEVYRLGIQIQKNLLTTSPSHNSDLVDYRTFEKACEETLESLTEYFEKIIEENDTLTGADVSYSSGVLTVNLGPTYGTYVINRQSPNRQIWLSSPVSGPKRYDFIIKDNCWVYKHDGQSLHRLLQNEISKIVNLEVNFSQCSYAKF